MKSSDKSDSESSNDSLETSERTSRRREANDLNDSFISTRSNSFSSQSHDDTIDADSFLNKQKQPKSIETKKESFKENYLTLSALENNQHILEKKQYDLQSSYRNDEYSKSLIDDKEKTFQNKSYYNQQQQQFLLLNKFYSDLRTKSSNDITGNLKDQYQQKGFDFFKNANNDMNKDDLAHFTNDFFQNAVVNFALMSKGNLPSSYSDLKDEFSTTSKLNSTSHFK